MKITGSLLPRLIKKYKGQSKPKAEALPTKLTFIPKSKTFKINPKHTRFHAEPIAKRDIASAIARRRETRSHIALTKKVEDAYKRTIAKPQKANQLKQLQAKKTRALTRAFTLSQKRGMKTLEKTSKKLDVNIKKFGTLEKGSRWDANMATRISAREAKELGFPPKVVSAEMKAFYAGQKPLAQAKRYRKTLSRVYAQPKSWKKRKEVVGLWRGKIKTELKQAQKDRQIFRGSTVQKLTGKTTFYRKGGKKVTKENWKTIHSPEKSYDVRTKRWK